MTLRTLIQLINLEQNHIKYYEKAYPDNKSKIKQISYNLIKKILNLFTSPYESYKLIKNIIVVIILYACYKKFIYAKF